MRLAPWALMAGNITTGISVLAPAGMLPELAAGLNVTVRDAGLLVTFGAVVLCFGSPLMAWATSRIDRRALLTGVLVVLGVSNILSALVPDYASLLALRIAMMLVGAIYTPQAAGAVALIVGEQSRARAISFVFIGWSAAVAFALPIATYLAFSVGWRETFGVVGAFGCLTSAGVWLAMPRGISGAEVSFRTWRQVFSSRLIMLLLTVTTLTMMGQFGVFIYLGPLLVTFVDAAPQQVAIAFLASGVAGLAGNVAAARMVGHLGAYRTTLIFLITNLIGALVWTFGTGSYALAVLSVAFFGLGLASVNSMQQGRLIAAGPTLAGASIALNTSAIYIGQAGGSAIAAVLYGAGRPELIGWSAMVILAAAMGTLWTTRPRTEAG